MWLVVVDNSVQVPHCGAHLQKHIHIVRTHWEVFILNLHREQHVPWLSTNCISCFCLKYPCSEWTSQWRRTTWMCCGSTCEQVPSVSHLTATSKIHDTDDDTHSKTCAQPTSLGWPKDTDAAWLSVVQLRSWVSWQRIDSFSRCPWPSLRAALTRGPTKLLAFEES